MASPYYNPSGSNPSNSRRLPTKKEYLVTELFLETELPSITSNGGGNTGLDLFKAAHPILAATFAIYGLAREEDSSRDWNERDAFCDLAFRVAAAEKKAPVDPETGKPMLSENADKVKKKLKEQRTTLRMRFRLPRYEEGKASSELVSATHLRLAATHGLTNST